MSKYVIEAGGDNNPRILAQREDGTYTVLTHGTGYKDLADLMDLVDRANNGYRFEEGQA